MKLFRSLLLTSSAIAFEFTVWDQPDEDAFSWIEPKSRLRREGDADDEKVLKFLDAKEKIEESKKMVRAGPPSKPGSQKYKKWQMKNGKVLNKKGKWVTPSKRPQENDYYYDDYTDAEYDDGYSLGDITDKQTDYTDLLLGDDVPEEELEGLISEIISLRSIDEDEFYDLARTEGTQAALERFMKRQYSRKKLGRKLTEEEKEQRKKNQMHVQNWEERNAVLRENVRQFLQMMRRLKNSEKSKIRLKFTEGQRIRAARRKRKQNRRLEQERRREWRKLHRNKETGDYDEYGPYQPQFTNKEHKVKSKQKQRRDRRKKRKNAKQSKNSSKNKPADKTPDFEDEYVYDPEDDVITSTSTTTTSTVPQTTPTTQLTTSGLILFSFFLTLLQ